MAFSPPSSLAASPRYSADSNAYFYQPPKSPVVTPSVATPGDYFSVRSRKRQRPDSARAHTRFSYSAQCPPTPIDVASGDSYEPDSAFVNERYRLAGGFDTPSLRATRLESAVQEENAFRRRLRDHDMDSFGARDCAPSFGPLARERNGAGRGSQSDVDQNSRNTWTGLAFGAIGIVGKVFSFGSTVVRGFYAGGGKGYDMNPQGRSGSRSPDGVLNQAAATSIPGSWANEDELLGEPEQDTGYSASLSQERPQNKRRQTDRDEWVVIGTPDLEGANPSLKRRISSNWIPRSSLGATASRASSRRSIAPITRRPSSYANVAGSPAQRAIVTTGGHSRRASIASPRSPHANPRPSTGDSGASQMSPETERFAKRQARQERQVDKTMSSMEQRMKDMIKQAQQALGTKYSVEVDDNMDLADDGFSSDEDW